MTIDWNTLQLQAAAAARLAYAPYSKFHVGAALLSEDGQQVFTGCNVENASYGLTICAERNAVWSAVAKGVQRFRAIAIVTSSERPVTPCGACRQVLHEFAPSFEVRCYGDHGTEVITSVAELLPSAFVKGDFTPG